MKANRKFRADEKAVSPVIGVILMVAITVVLAAIIGAFVFGMAPPAMAPQVSIRGMVVQVDGKNVIKLEHQGGDTLTIDDANIKVLVNDAAIKGYPPAGTQLSTGEVAYIWIEKGDYHLNKTAPAPSNVTAPVPETGKIATVKIVDVASQQLIADIRVRG